MWTDRLLNKGAGLDYVDELLEISEMTGRLSPELRGVVTVLARLMGGHDTTARLTAREIVSPLAQLDALLGNEPSADNRLLSLLLQDPGDMPSTPP
jgi:hypothetical protein